MEQRRIIKEDLKPDKVILAFDNDEAGQALNQKSADGLRGIDCYAVQWEGVEWPDEDEEEFTVVPNDVAEMPQDRLKALLDAAQPYAAKVLKKDLKKDAKPS